MSSSVRGVVNNDLNVLAEYERLKILEHVVVNSWVDILFQFEAFIRHLF